MSAKKTTQRDLHYGRRLEENAHMQFYTVLECADSPELLLDALNKVAAEGGRVISVTWQPPRILRLGRREVSHVGGFTIVAEHLANETKPAEG